MVLIVPCVKETRMDDNNTLLSPHTLRLLKLILEGTAEHASEAAAQLQVLLNPGYVIHHGVSDTKYARSQVQTRYFEKK